jgi:hypothetical protein
MPACPPTPHPAPCAVPWQGVEEVTLGGGNVVFGYKRIISDVSWAQLLHVFPGPAPWEIGTPCCGGCNKAQPVDGPMHFPYHNPTLDAHSLTMLLIILYLSPPMPLNRRTTAWT